MWQKKQLFDETRLFIWGVFWGDFEEGKFPFGAIKQQKRKAFSSWEAQLDHIWTHAFRSKHLLHQSDIYQSFMTTNLRNEPFQSIWLLLAWSKQTNYVQTFPKPSGKIIPLHPGPPFEYQPSVSFVVPCRATSSVKESGSWKETGRHHLTTLWFFQDSGVPNSSSCSRKIHPWLQIVPSILQGSWDLIANWWQDPLAGRWGKFHPLHNLCIASFYFIPSFPNV